jgi:hypothetical protein
MTPHKVKTFSLICRTKPNTGSYGLAQYQFETTYN